MWKAATENDGRAMFALMDDGEVCGPHVMAQLAKLGNLHLLVACAHAGCVVDGSVCAEAVRAGRWDTVVWLHDAGYKLDEIVLIEALRTSRWDMAVWALHAMCPLGPASAQIAATRYSAEQCLVYLDHIENNHEEVTTGSYAIEAMQAADILLGAVVTKSAHSVSAMKWLHDNAYVISREVVAHADETCLLWLKDQSKPESWRRMAVIACVALGDSSALVSKLDVADSTCDATNLYKFSADQADQHLLRELMRLGYEFSTKDLRDLCTREDVAWLTKCGVFIDAVCAESTCTIFTAPYEWLCAEHFPAGVDAILAIDDAMPRELGELIAAIAATGSTCQCSAKQIREDALSKPPRLTRSTRLALAGMT